MDTINEGLNSADIGQTEISFGRKLSPAQYEMVELNVKVIITPASGSAGDDISEAVRALAVRVESELAMVKQRADLYKRLYARLLKLNVTADDAASALDALGIKEWPVGLSDILAACQRVESIKGIEDLPLAWVWFKDGKHPHPRLGLPVEAESRHPSLDTETTQVVSSVQEMPFGTGETRHNPEEG